MTGVLVSILTAAVLVLLAGWAVTKWGSKDQMEIATVAAAPSQTPAQPATAVTTPVVSAYPFAKLVEVTGVRVIVDLNRKSQVQYIVVNHSSAELTNVGVHVQLKKATSGDTLCAFSARIPALGAYASKEIRTDLAGSLRAAVPDWQNIQPDVQVTSEQ